MTVRRFLFGLALLCYLVLNALNSPDTAVFFGQLIAHTFIAGVCFLMFGLLYIFMPDEMDAILDTIDLVFGPSDRLRDMLDQANNAPAA